MMHRLVSLLICIILAGCVGLPDAAGPEDASKNALTLADGWFTMSGRAHHFQTVIAAFVVMDEVLHPNGSLVMEIAVDTGVRQQDFEGWSVAVFHRTTRGLDLAGAAFELEQTQSVNGQAAQTVTPTFAPARVTVGMGLSAGDEIEISFASGLQADPQPGLPTAQLRPEAPVTYLWRFVPPGDSAEVPTDVQAFRNALGHSPPVEIVPARNSGPFVHANGFLYLGREGGTMEAATSGTGRSRLWIPSPLAPREGRDVTVNAQPLSWGTFVGLVGGAGGSVEHQTQVWEGGDQEHAPAPRFLPTSPSSGDPRRWDPLVTIRASGWQPETSTRTDILRVTWSGAPVERMAAVFHMTGRAGDSRPYAERALGETSGGATIRLEGKDIVATLPGGQVWTWVRCCDPPGSGLPALSPDVERTRAMHPLQ